MSLCCIRGWLLVYVSLQFLNVPTIQNSNIAKEKLIHLYLLLPRVIYILLAENLAISTALFVAEQLSSNVPYNAAIVLFLALLFRVKSSTFILLLLCSLPYTTLSLQIKSNRHRRGSPVSSYASSTA